MPAPASVRLMNTLMSAILRSPLHSMVSKQVLLITVTGRKTGKKITTPVSYSRDGAIITIISRGTWVKNLSGGAPVTLRIQGKDYPGSATAITDDLSAKCDGISRHLSVVRGDARFFGVTFDPDGTPNREQVLRAAEKNSLVCVQI